MRARLIVGEYILYNLLNFCVFSQIVEIFTVTILNSTVLKYKMHVVDI